MKKAKITVLHSTFNEDFACHYGIPGLKPCTLVKEGQVFYAGLGNPKASVTVRGKPFIPMYLLLPTAHSTSISTIGYDSRGWRLPVATTVCVPYFSNRKQPMKKLNPHSYDNNQNSIRQ